MKTNFKNTFLSSDDEFTGLYNWSERSSVFFSNRKNSYRDSFFGSMIDLFCMAAITVATVSCL